MITTYLRSSSYNTYDFCEHKYFMDYVLGYRSPPLNNKADKGTIVHKALELLARKKLAIQNKQQEFKDDELGCFINDDVTPEIVLDVAYKHISKKSEKLYDWSDKDYKDCLKWLYMSLEYNNGMFNPMNQDVVSPETYFDITIDKPWAYYDFKLPNGENVSGQLAIKGTLDLLVRINPTIYELVDYKTGERKDWNTGKEKTYKDFQKDAQLKIYHYAARKLFPQIEQIIVSIFYVRSGGVFSMNFTDEDISDAETMLEKRFEKIKKNKKPKRILPDWKCNKLCYFGTRNEAGEKINRDDFKKESICQNIYNEVLTLGLDRVTLAKAKSDFRNYGSGGGRSGNSNE